MFYDSFSLDIAKVVLRSIDTNALAERVNHC